METMVNMKSGIDLSTLAKHVPAVFAKKPMPGVSDSYKFVSTIEVIERMEKAGMIPVQVSQYAKRDGEGFARHVVKFRPAGDASKLLVRGEVIPQAVIVNSHDRSTALRFMYGLHRVLCENGMVAPVAGMSGTVSSRHLGDINKAVDDALKMMEGFGKNVTPVIDLMMKAQLTDKQVFAFARKAIELKASVQNPRSLVLKPEDIAGVRREADAGNSVWKVFNRVQENIIKGGVAAYGEGERTRLTRPITSVATDLRINSVLWELAAKTAAEVIGKAKRS